MTTLFKISARCFVCGRTSEHTAVGSYYEAVGPDLDTRPGEMGRSNMEYWIQECPFCGYCGPEISKGQPGRAEIVKSEAYQTRLTKEVYSRLASRFLCWALIQEEAGEFVDAGWANVHAAWACDDQGVAESARGCRKEAIRLFQVAMAQNEKIVEGNGAQHHAGYVLLSDLWRRVGEFDRALEVCREE